MNINIELPLASIIAISIAIIIIILFFFCRRKDSNHPIVIALSLIAFALSVTTALCLFCGTADRSLSFNYGDASVAVISVLVTILLGWNIAAALGLKKEWDEHKAQMNEFEEKNRKKLINKSKEFENKAKKIEAKIKKIQKDIDAFQNYGYAITDFCQAFTCLGPPQKNYWEIYCKILNSFRCFLKTKEKIDWYAPACIDNLKEASNRAKSLNEICSQELNNSIDKYLDEIRRCPKNNFKCYWKKILEIEDERKKYNDKETVTEKR